VSTWAHLGGGGRGWAVLVDVDAAQDRCSRRCPPKRGRVLGPYFACGGVEVWVTNDVVVVLGDSDHTLAPRCSPEDLRGVAEALDADA